MQFGVEVCVHTDYIHTTNTYISTLTRVQWVLTPAWSKLTAREKQIQPLISLKKDRNPTKQLLLFHKSQLFTNLS